MANTLCRRILYNRKIWYVHEICTLAAYPQSNIFTNKIIQLKSQYEKIYIPLPNLVDGWHIKHYSDHIGNEKSGDTVADDKTKKSLFQKFKDMYKSYWYVLVPVHLVTSAMWFGGFYYMAKSGIDIVGFLESCHVSEKLINPLKDSSMGYIAIAYALYKIITPARYAVTLGGTTVSINILKKWGYLKPLPSKQRIKEIYQQRRNTIAKSIKETKEGIKDKRENLMGSIHDTKEDIEEKKKHFMESVSKTTENLKKKRSEIKEKMSSIKEKT